MNKHLSYILMICLIAGCSTVPSTQYRSVSYNPAVVSLIDEAFLLSEQGHLALAQSKIERALRIEPKNPALWLELAYNHERQQDNSGALNMAKRARSYASDRAMLTRINTLVGRLSESH
ncbi:MAG: hypothetical protein K6L76_12025 [Agarilytica sp.]